VFVNASQKFGQSSPKKELGREQRLFLQKRLRNAIEHQPELKALRRLLLSIDGTELVAPSCPDADLLLLLERGFVMAGGVRLKNMIASECHRNVAKLWAKKKKDVVGLGTGYGMTDDGLWRQHSWLVLRQGILETTKERTHYFGILLQGQAAADFVINNS
jgi:hypothetical protein